MFYYTVNEQDKCFYTMVCKHSNILKEMFCGRIRRLNDGKQYIN